MIIETVEISISIQFISFILTILSVFSEQFFIRHMEKIHEKSIGEFTKSMFIISAIFMPTLVIMLIENKIFVFGILCASIGGAIIGLAATQYMTSSEKNQLEACVNKQELHYYHENFFKSDDTND